MPTGLILLPLSLPSLSIDPTDSIALVWSVIVLRDSVSLRMLNWCVLFSFSVTVTEDPEAAAEVNIVDYGELVKTLDSSA